MLDGVRLLIPIVDQLEKLGDISIKLGTASAIPESSVISPPPPIPSPFGTATPSFSSTSSLGVFFDGIGGRESPELEQRQREEEEDQQEGSEGQVDAEYLRELSNMLNQPSPSSSGALGSSSTPPAEGKEREEPEAEDREITTQDLRDWERLKDEAIKEEQRRKGEEEQRKDETEEEQRKNEEETPPPFGTGEDPSSTREPDGLISDVLPEGLVEDWDFIGQKETPSQSSSAAGSEGIVPSSDPLADYGGLPSIPDLEKRVSSSNPSAEGLYKLPPSIESDYGGLPSSFEPEGMVPSSNTPEEEHIIIEDSELREFLMDDWELRKERDKKQREEVAKLMAERRAAKEQKRREEIEEEEEEDQFDEKEKERRIAEAEKRLAERMNPKMKKRLESSEEDHERAEEKKKKEAKEKGFEYVELKKVERQETLKPIIHFSPDHASKVEQSEEQEEDKEEMVNKGDELDHSFVVVKAEKEKEEEEEASSGYPSTPQTPDRFKRRTPLESPYKEPSAHSSSSSSSAGMNLLETAPPDWEALGISPIKSSGTFGTPSKSFIEPEDGRGYDMVLDVSTPET